MLINIDFRGLQDKVTKFLETYKKIVFFKKYIFLALIEKFVTLSCLSIQEMYMKLSEIKNAIDKRKMDGTHSMIPPSKKINVEGGDIATAGGLCIGAVLPTKH